MLQAIKVSMCCRICQFKALCVSVAGIINNVSVLQVITSVSVLQAY